MHSHFLELFSLVNEDWSVHISLLSQKRWLFPMESTVLHHVLTTCDAVTHDISHLFHINQSFCPNQPWRRQVSILETISISCDVTVGTTKYKLWKWSSQVLIMCFIQCKKCLMWVWISHCVIFIAILKATTDSLLQILKITCTLKLNSMRTNKCIPWQRWYQSLGMYV